MPSERRPVGFQFFAAAPFKAALPGEHHQPIFMAMARQTLSLFCLLVRNDLESTANVFALNELPENVGLSGQSRKLSLGIHSSPNLPKRWCDLTRASPGYCFSFSRPLLTDDPHAPRRPGHHLSYPRRGEQNLAVHKSEDKICSGPAS